MVTVEYPERIILQTTLKQVMEYFAVKYAALILDVTDLEKLTVGRVVDLAKEMQDRTGGKPRPRPDTELEAEIQLRLARARNRF